jgi:hypothetical protein
MTRSSRSTTNKWGKKFRDHLDTGERGGRGRYWRTYVGWVALPIGIAACKLTLEPNSLPTRPKGVGYVGVYILTTYV